MGACVSQLRTDEVVLKSRSTACKQKVRPYLGLMSGQYASAGQGALLCASSLDGRCCQQSLLSSPKGSLSRSEFLLAAKRESELRASRTNHTS